MNKIEINEPGTYLKSFLIKKHILFQVNFAIMIYVIKVLVYMMREEKFSEAKIIWYVNEDSQGLSRVVEGC